MIKTRYPTANGKLTIVNNNIKMKKVVQRFCVSIHCRISLVVLLNADNNMKVRIRKAIGRRILSTVLLLKSLNTLIHKFILSLGDKCGLDVDDFAGDEMMTGTRSSFVPSILSKFIVVV
jgi:hypothetical protein